MKRCKCDEINYENVYKCTSLLPWKYWANNFSISENITVEDSKAGAYIFLFAPPSKYGKCHDGGKKLLKGDEKGGKCMFFPNWLKYEYFFPNWLYIYKITKILNIFACGAHYLIIINFLWGKIWIKKGGGGHNYQFQI